HTCARMSDGTVRCWGSDESGQLGDGKARDAGLAGPVVARVKDVVELDAAGASTCARRSDGSVHCWGDNSAGQLCTGTVGGAVTEPQALPGIQNAVHVAMSRLSVCVILKDGAVLCCGSNHQAQLGEGPRRAWPTPTRSGW